MATTTHTQAASVLAVDDEPGKALHLADTFNPDIDTLVSEGLIAFGVKGAGKSNVLARISEELGRFHLPQIILDTEREYQSLIDYFPRGVLATATRFPSAYDILNSGLQVIVDLRSWESDESAALAIIQLINELFTVSAAQKPQDRVPCVVSLDEAGYWLPQESSVSYLTKSTRQALADVFHRLATRGRKLGLVPFLYSQSISEIAKTAIRQAGVKVLMRQSLDIDLNRYAEYIRNCTPARKKAIQAFAKGKAVVILPDGTQQLVQFYERESEHSSHTPLSQAALVKFATTPIDLAALPMRDLTGGTSHSAESGITQKVETQLARACGKAGRPKTKQKLVSFKFTAETIALLNGLPEGTKTKYVEELIQSNRK